MRDWLSHRVVSSPDDTALVRAEDGESWTYTDLDRLVTETAGRLAARGIEEGDRLGVLTPPYVGTVGLVHAAMRIGATFVPLGTELTERELSERVERADVSAIVCAEPTEGAAVAAVDDVAGIPVFSVDEPNDETVGAVHAVDPEPVDPPRWEFSDHLCMLFTSGTTGAPKPVPLTAGNVYSSAVASAFRLGVEADDRWLVSLSLHHMGGLAPVYRSALYGTTLVLREGFHPGGTADDIDTYDVTGVSLVPTMLKRMLDRRGTLSDTLRAVLLGGAPAPNELLERCRDYSVPVYPTYGMTEAASQIATATPRQTKGRLGTVGRPLFGTDVTIVDEDGSPVEPGETGEIVVDGPTITPGYVDRDSADSDGADGSNGSGSSNESGSSNGSDGLDRSEFGPHGLHTGDVGRFDENGYLYVLNRLDDRIITGGENVEPGEVADALRTVPDIEDAAVVGLDDDVWGERVAALLAVDAADGERSGDGDDGTDGNETVDSSETIDPTDDDDATDDDDDNATDDDDATNDDDDATDDDGSRTSDVIPPIADDRLVSHLRDRIAGFKIPKTVAYTDEIPRTVSGTINREEVRKVLRDRGYDPRNGDEGELEMAGFEPAEPAEPPESSAGPGEHAGSRQDFEGENASSEMLDDGVRSPDAPDDERGSDEVEPDDNDESELDDEPKLDDERAAIEGDEDPADTRETSK